MGLRQTRYGLFTTSRVEEIGQGVIQDVISRSSNLGSDNPFKGPTARSLFYDAASRNPPKYGQFLFYSLGNNDTNFIDAYYRSESSSYNRNVSSLKSKNPSAGFLVRETIDAETLSSVSQNGNLPGLTSNFERSIIGGLSAPYHWKDFLYCRYYGTIPNNYMITLRRYPTPVLDNLSLPELVKNSEASRKRGAGRPVAQAVTWFGANTGNNLKELLSFTTGLVWDPRDQKDTVDQAAFSKGFFNDLPYTWLQNAVQTLSSPGGNVLKNGVDLFEKATVALDPLNETVESLRAFSLRDKSTDARFGLLSNFIWVPVDTVTKMEVRGRGLTFNWEQLNITFEYELTSVGEVNTKAAFLDILGNLLAIGTNYGNYLTPNFRYNSQFPPVGFPGGDKGLQMFYSDPLAWLMKYGQEIVSTTKTQTQNSNENSEGGQTTPGAFENSDGGGSAQGDVSQFTQAMKDLIQQGGAVNFESVKKLLPSLQSGFSRLLKLVTTEEFISSWQMPTSFLTGAPTGEWHLVIGNPCNPIAMIGNLICSGVTISFSDNLGPDDFPTGIKAVFSLKHARDRERGEIESIFNRGDGRLYQTSAETTSNLQSFDAFANTDGEFLSTEGVNEIFSNIGASVPLNDQNSPSPTTPGNTPGNIPPL